MFSRQRRDPRYAQAGRRMLSLLTLHLVLPSQQELLVFVNLSVYMHALVPRFVFMTFKIHLISYSFISFAVTLQGLDEPGLYVPLA